MPIISDNEFPKVILTEQAEPATPAAATAKLFLDTADGILKWKADDGSVYEMGQAPAAPEWQAWTPTIKLGTTTVTLSGNASKYLIDGAITFWIIDVILSSGGTGTLSANDIPAALQVSTNYKIVGNALLLDQGVTFHHVAVAPVSATVWNFFNTYPPYSATWASGDQIVAQGFIITPA